MMNRREKVHALSGIRTHSLRAKTVKAYASDSPATRKQALLKSSILQEKIYVWYTT
jgi:hypothetical protein